MSRPLMACSTASGSERPLGITALHAVAGTLGETSPIASKAGCPGSPRRPRTHSGSGGASTTTSGAAARAFSSASCSPGARKTSKHSSTKAVPRGPRPPPVAVDEQHSDPVAPSLDPQPDASELVLHGFGCPGLGDITDHAEVAHQLLVLGHRAHQNRNIGGGGAGPKLREHLPAVLDR